MFVEAPASKDVERPLQTDDEDYQQQRPIFVEAPTSMNVERPLQKRMPMSMDVDRPLNAADLTDGNPNCSDLPLLDSTVFEVIDHGTEKGRRLLVNNHGYNYCVKSKVRSTTYWHCCFRNASLECKDSMRQVDDKLFRGAHEHIHPATPALTT